jgi:hypothetical protein
MSLFSWAQDFVQKHGPVLKVLVLATIVVVSLIAIILASISLHKSRNPDENTVNNITMTGNHPDQVISKHLEKSIRLGSLALPEKTPRANKIVLYTTFHSNPLFEGVCDVYDNSLVLHYLTSTMQISAATLLARSILVLMVKEGWNPDGATAAARLQNFGLLSVRYTANGSLPSGDLAWESGIKDIGNNSYVGISLAKYGIAMFPDDSIDKNPYKKAAFDILNRIHTSRLYSGNIKGYIARDRGRPGSYMSMEHHIDMYSLASIMLTMKLTDAEKLVCENSLKISVDFMETMWNPTKKYFNVGTGYTIDENGSTLSTVTINTTTPTPVDCQTWRALAVNMESLKDTKTNESLLWAVKQTAIQDSWKGTVGCSSGSEEFMPNPVCTEVPEAYRVTGFKFTESARGIQLENTGSGMLALIRARKLGSLQDSSVDKTVSDVHKSLESIFTVFPDGIPGSLRAEGAYPRMKKNGEELYHDETYSNTTIEETNTGITWSYWRYPHTASTIYCWLAYQASQSGSGMNDNDVEMLNPYSTKVTPFNFPDKKLYNEQVISSFAKDIPVTDIQGAFGLGLDNLPNINLADLDNNYKDGNTINADRFFSGYCSYEIKDSYSATKKNRISLLCNNISVVPENLQMKFLYALHKQ